MNNITYVILFVILLILIVLFYGILYSDLTKCSESQKMTAPKITDTTLMIDNNNGTLPLSQYHIFSSWNTACSGKFVSTQQILNVLTTGCRMVDLPITDVSGEPMICPNFTNDLSTNSIPLNMAVQTCVNNAFQKYITINYDCAGSSSQNYTLNNYEDPLFIQLRFGNTVVNKDDVISFLNKNTDNPLNITVEFLNKIAEQVGFTIKGLQYSTQTNTIYTLDTTTNLQDLKNKVILLVDVTAFPLDIFKKSELSKITNLVVGDKSGLMMYPFKILLDSTPENIPNKNTNTITKFNMALPDTLLNIQPNIQQIMELAVYHNVQFMPFLFYRTNTLLKDYINLFQSKKSAFLPIEGLNKTLLQENEKAIMR